MDAVSQPFRIVVVDDSPIYRKLVETTLTIHNYSPLIANNGTEALDLIARYQPAIVITDWEMPDISGIELSTKIRSNLDSYTYIILVTANTKKDQIVRGLAAGADDYLTKPFHPGELLARVAVGRRIAELHRQIQTKSRLLEEMALTDQLTGLPNRRALENWGSRELSAAARHDFPFWLAMADLDHFKNVNDTYGHDAGDQILRGFADLLKSNTRASNMCGRLGGEEFLIALSHIDQKSVMTAVDRIRTELEAREFVVGQSVIRVTASFGIAGFRSTTATEFAHLLRSADTALYAAKRSGRNRINFAEINVARQGV